MMQIRGGNAFIGDSLVAAPTSNTNSALSLMQGCNDNEILTLKSTDVGHPMTCITDADTYLRIKKITAGSGGACIAAFADGSDLPMKISGASEGNISNSSSLGSVGVINMYTYLNNSGNLTNPGGGYNLFVIKSADCARFIVDQEGDVKYDGTTSASAWDEYCDVQLLTASRAIQMPECSDFRKRFGGFIDDHAQTLHDTGVITLNDDGHD